MLPKLRGERNPALRSFVTDHQRQVLSEPRRPLSSEHRVFFEPRLGAELASVRIHDDSRAAKSADIISYPFNLFVESMSFPISTAHLVLPASPIAALKG